MQRFQRARLLQRIRLVVNRPGRAQGELTIGIVGPHELVERIMLSPASAVAKPGAGVSGAGLGPESGPPRRLVAAAYRDEQEAADQVVRLGAAIDVCLFASRVPYEYARTAGVLTVPATFVPLGGGALYAALLKASSGESAGLDPARASIDVLSRADVEEAFADLGLPTLRVHVREDSGSPAVVASFHERLWRRNETSVAFTCLQSVAARLAAAGIPAITLRPAGSDIRVALRTAALIGGYRRLEDAQLALALVEVPALRDGGRRASPRQSRDELRLTVHRFLVQEAQRIHAAVSPTGDHGFLIVATRGSLARVTEGFRIAPFADRARSELGVAIEVGIGTGRTAVEAEAHARASLGRAQAGSGLRGFTATREGHAPVPPPRLPEAGARRSRSLETLSRLAEKLSDADANLVVDAETAGQLLAVTPRTARRLLHLLVEEGLAWPLPPNRTPQPGRPRQFYRLVVEQLEQQRRRDEPGTHATR
jgi:hypothetical protein